MTDTDLLRDVVARSEAYNGARDSLYRAIREAHDAGHSLRAIAAEALISHEQVRRIVAGPRPVGSP
jgi:hypothetical protein